MGDGDWNKSLLVYKYAYEVEEATKLKVAAVQDLLEYIGNAEYEKIGNHVQDIPHNMLVDFTKILLKKWEYRPGNFEFEELMAEEIKAEKDD
jgi:predicted ferric reductase